MLPLTGQYSKNWPHDPIWHLLNVLGAAANIEKGVNDMKRKYRPDVGDWVRCRDVFHEGQVGQVVAKRGFFISRMYTIQLINGNIIETATVRRVPEPPRAQNGHMAPPLNV